MSETDSGEHWLSRYTQEEWLRASKVELRRCLEALHARSQKKGVASGRRAAGMALNALLLSHPNESWGRSYVEHLRALALDEAVPEVVRDSAKELLESPTDAPRLVRLGGADESIAAAAATIIDWTEARLSGEA